MKNNTKLELEKMFSKKAPPQVNATQISAKNDKNIMSEEEAKKHLEHLNNTKRRRTFIIQDNTTLKQPEAASKAAIAEKILAETMVFPKLKADIEKLLKDYQKTIVEDAPFLEHKETTEKKYHLFEALIKIFKNMKVQQQPSKKVATLIKNACELHDQIEDNKKLSQVTVSLSALANKLSITGKQPTERKIELNSQLVDSYIKNLQEMSCHNSSFDAKNRAGEILKEVYNKTVAFEKGTYIPPTPANSLTLKK